VADEKIILIGYRPLRDLQRKERKEIPENSPLKGWHFFGAVRKSRGEIAIRVPHGRLEDESIVLGGNRMVFGSKPAPALRHGRRRSSKCNRVVMRGGEADPIPLGLCQRAASRWGIDANALLLDALFVFHQ